jgi:hypothetical protein
VADAIKDDIWPDPLRWFSQYEESMGALFELEGEDDGAGVEEEGEEEGEEEYEVDGEEDVEYEQGAGEFTVCSLGLRKSRPNCSGTLWRLNSWKVRGVGCKNCSCRMGQEQ